MRVRETDSEPQRNSSPLDSDVRCPTPEIMKPERRIAPMPFTLRNLRRDLPDVGSNFDGSPELEFRAASKALGLEQSGLSYQRIPPDYRFPYGHTHEQQEEVFVVVGGSGRMKLDADIVELTKWDAVRVPPGTWRGYEAGPEGLELLVVGKRPRAALETATRAFTNCSLVRRLGRVSAAPSH
jgi:uncharacterized cupin superfamily protein